MSTEDFPPSLQDPTKVSPQPVEEEKLDQKAERGISAFTTAYTGPLPPPGMLRGYHEIDATFSDRIIAMAEAEQKHRHESEIELSKHRQALISSQVENSKRGQHHALVIGLSCILAICGIAIFAPPTVGAIVGSALSFSSIGGLVAVYLGWWKQSSAEEPTTKTKREDDNKEQ